MKLRQSRKMITKIWLLLVLPFTSLCAQSWQSSPFQVDFVYDDVERFWAAFDSTEGKTLPEQVDIYQKMYLDQATDGFRSWIVKRSKTAQQLAEGIEAMRPFYVSIRDNTLSVSSMEKEVRAGFLALKYLYPEALFPNVYFFVCHFFSTGSTTTDLGLMISAETVSIDEKTPLDAIPEIHRPMVKSMTQATVPSLVLHESIHFQQADYDVTNLLELSIREGSADFISELCTGRLQNDPVHRYASSKRQALWKEFNSKMLTNNFTGWRYIPKDRPAGLAYWMGYQISEAYFINAPDKLKAIHYLINTDDYHSVYEESKFWETID